MALRLFLIYRQGILIGILMMIRIWGTKLGNREWCCQGGRKRLLVYYLIQILKMMDQGENRMVQDHLQAKDKDQDKKIIISKDFHNFKNILSELEENN